MTQLQLSAQFAAYIWFTSQPENADKSNAEAHQYARLNWEQFLANANEGLGRLLMELSEPRDTLRCPRVRVRVRRQVEAVGSVA